MVTNGYNHITWGDWRRDLFNSTSRTVAVSFSTTNAVQLGSRINIELILDDFQLERRDSCDSVLLECGQIFGGNDMCGQIQGTDQMVALNNLPTDGSTIYV